jgi:hypothetical protein
MVTLFCQAFPLGEVVRALFLDVVLSVGSVRSSKFLRNRILDLDSLYSLREIRERVAPAMREWLVMLDDWWASCWWCC